ncbi:MAG: HDIG domain-containing protein, partial [Planctomycetales bacterium]|nr:HDIG domain-containing protein [Planctomycetales bacterium]
LQGWRPAFSFREGQIPQRDVVARVAFDRVDASQTELLRKQKRREVLCFYENRSQPISQLISTIKNKFSALLGDTPYSELPAEQQQTLAEFMPADSGETQLTPAEALAHIRNLLDERTTLEGGKFDQALKTVLDPIAETGVLKALGHDSEQGNQRSIIVFAAGLPEDKVFVDVPKVRHAEIVAELPQKVAERFQQAFSQNPDAVIVARMVSTYLTANLPVTLTYQQNLSEEARHKAAESVEDAIVSYFATVSKLAQAGVPISRTNELPLLRAEYEAWVQQLSWAETLIRLLAFAGMLAALYLLCGLYIYFQYDRRLLTHPTQLLRLLGLVVVTCLLCRYSSPDPMRAEVVPLVLCAMTMTITVGRQVAMLISTCLALAITLGLGLDIGAFVTLSSGSCAAALLLGRIRTRTKLIYVGLAAGAIVAATHMGVDIVRGTVDVAAAAEVGSNVPPKYDWLALLSVLAAESFRLGGFTLLAGALMSGLLPFAEKIFGIQTDLSLLELGDASHPLLRQLAQRAPGTYNHSINVAAIAEAAADSIGAHGLLTRVGAYFHDIGKMFKPNYFVENQEQGGNCHDTLQPAMSTLVIIAHVKDGADLARKNRLPKPIIDFIEQHHGTTLVEYFYREAAKRSANNPNKEEVSETSFRYPGPKPQTLEAAVLMLADSVESASRTLVEPTSSRIQNLVDQIAMKKLLDGQFDQCGLTLQQLDQLKSSLVKSLTAIYHGRVKYTGQASA